MKTIVLASVLAIAAVSASAAPQSEPAASDTVQIRAKAAYRLSPQDFNDYAATYQLETGHQVKFTQGLHRYFAALRGEAKVEIYPVARGVFVSDNGARIVFSDSGDTLLISHPELLPAGVALAPSARPLTAQR